MDNKGKIILNLAMSIDGYIADEDGGFDWIGGDGDSSLNTEKGHDFAAFTEKIDIVLMGNECYKQNMAEHYKDKIVYVATTKQQDDLDNIHFIGGDIVSIMEQQAQEGKNVFLFGGGVVVDPFIKQDAIDEYIIGIVPILLGKGRKLFLENNPTLKLHLDSYIVENGLPILTYSKRK